MKKAIDILQKKVTEAFFHLDIDEVNVIVEAMEDYAEQFKILNKHGVVGRSKQLCKFYEPDNSTARICINCSEPKWMHE